MVEWRHPDAPERIVIMLAVMALVVGLYRFALWLLDRKLAQLQAEDDARRAELERKFDKVWEQQGVSPELRAAVRDVHDSINECHKALRKLR